VSVRAVGVLTILALAVLPGPVDAGTSAAPTPGAAAPRGTKDERAPGPKTTRDERTTAPKAGKDDRTQPVTVDADKMERFGKEGLVVFTGNVVARQNNSVQYAERMEVYLDEAGDKISRTVSTGAVRIITSDCRTGTARRAEYYDLDQRVVLIGNARVWQEDNVVSGETITIYLSQDRSVVQSGKQERVKAVFYPKDDKPSAPPTADKPATLACSN
jgi:lipopolysaccharide export system protein LptA